MREGKYGKTEGEKAREGLGKTLEKQGEELWKEHDKRVEKELMPKGDQPEEKVEEKDK